MNQARIRAVPARMMITHQEPAALSLLQLRVRSAPLWTPLGVIPLSHTEILSSPEPVLPSQLISPLPLPSPAPCCSLEKPLPPSAGSGVLTPPQRCFSASLGPINTLQGAQGSLWPQSSSNLPCNPEREREEAEPSSPSSFFFLSLSLFFLLPLSLPLADLLFPVAKNI